MDSVLNEGRLDFLQQSKGNFLYSTATSNSIMDYSIKVMEDSIVDSPPSHNPVLTTVMSPLLLKGRIRLGA